LRQLQLFTFETANDATKRLKEQGRSLQEYSERID